MAEEGNRLAMENDEMCNYDTRLFAVTGALTSLGTTIAVIPIESTQKKNIRNLIDDCGKSIATFEEKTEALKQTLRKCDWSESLYFGEFFRHKRQRDIKKWLKAGYLHRDVDVISKDLKKGDHIFRNIGSSSIYKHHGIYINDQSVVEFSRQGVGSRPLEAFSQNHEIKRREYSGCAMPAEETEKLAKEALYQYSSEHRYDLLNYNCEHFATAMTLSILWSSQVDETITTTSEVFKNVHRPISLIMEGVESGAQITTALAPKTIFSFFSGFSTPVMSNLAKAALVLGPVSVALDITSLVFEFKKENVSADICRHKIDQMKKIKSVTQTFEKNLKTQMAELDERRHQAELLEDEIRRLEAKRIEEERIEKERIETKRIEEEKIQRQWQDDKAIKIIGFCILYFFQFLTELCQFKEF